MAYIIAEPCQHSKDGSCQKVCPVKCIHPGIYTSDDGTVYDQLFIHPDDCIDCALCVDECPVGAIFADSKLPAKWKAYEKINRDAFESGQVEE